MESEPQYRLVADEDEPITIAMLVEPDRAPTIEGDQLSENYAAAERAAAAASVTGRPGAADWRDDTERVKDLLSDLFHLCDLLGLDMDEMVNTAQRNYAAEIRGEL